MKDQVVIMTKASADLRNTITSIMQSRDNDVVIVNGQEVKPFVITNRIPETFFNFKYPASKQRNTNFTKPKKKRKKS